MSYPDVSLTNAPVRKELGPSGQGTGILITFIKDFMYLQGSSKILLQAVSSILKCFCFAFFSGFVLPAFSQEARLSRAFDFNNHRIAESQNRDTIKPYGVNLVDDRFGNANSALYIQGHTSSYLNLGGSDALKSTIGSVSFWINIHGGVLAGKGYLANPLLLMRRCGGEDFNLALSVGYHPYTKHVSVFQSKDSLHEAAMIAISETKLYTWYHLVITYDDQWLSLFVNGELQGRARKGFSSVFMSGDSVLIGKTPGLKNERFTLAVFDDIRFFNGLLSAEQIDNLYHEPDPNRRQRLLREIGRYLIFALILILTVVALLFFNRRKLKRQEERHELTNRINELEVKVIRNQMNPHFISNSLSAIQQLVYSGQNEKAAEYLANFSFLMRKVLDYSENHYIRLSEELEIISLTVELEQLRFEDKFRFDLEIEEGIDPEQVFIPSLVTQPFIENAIWHGLLLLTTRRPVLTVKIYKQNGKVSICIEDNGVGRKVKSDVVRKSKGTQLVREKMESLNRFSNSADNNFAIFDLSDENGQPMGTRVILNLSETDPYV